MCIRDSLIVDLILGNGGILGQGRDALENLDVLRLVGQCGQVILAGVNAVLAGIRVALLLDLGALDVYKRQTLLRSPLFFLPFCFRGLLSLPLDLNIDCGDNIRLLVRGHIEKYVRGPVELVETVVNVV